MKYFNLLIIASLFMASCTTQIEIQTPINFEGTYLSTFECDGVLNEINGEEFTTIITRVDDNVNYRVDLGDDTVFGATVVDNVLTIETQTLNEDMGFDMVTLSGTISRNADRTFSFDFEHEVDEEGKSSCGTVLIKQ